MIEPKPDEGRLLSPEALLDIITESDKLSVANHCTLSEAVENGRIAIAKAQRDLTVSENDAEKQEAIRQEGKDILKLLDDTHVLFESFRQALKEKHVGKEE